MTKYIFTLHEANDLILWLESKFIECDLLQSDRDQIQTELSSLLRESHGNGKGGMETDIVEMQKRLDSTDSDLGVILEEITDRNIIVRNLTVGLVDFLGIRDGEEVFLCWVRGESTIKFWHKINEGFSSRKPI